MRVRMLLVIVLIFSVIGPGCWIVIIQHNENQYTSQITIKQIREVLRRMDLPDLPQEWDLGSIKKYDDGVASPSVIVSYKNGVTVRLTRSLFTFKHGFVKQNPPERWKQRVDYYRSDDSIAYVFTLNRLTYAFTAPINLKAEVDKMINNMLKLG